jgi:adenylate cyclase
VRVNAQLIDAETGAHLWADQFDADRADLLQMQDEIVTRLARAMQVQLVAVDAARVTSARPDNLDAEDLAMRCEAGVWNYTAGSGELAAAFSLCDRALHIDNNNVVALVVMTMRYIVPVVESQSQDPQADIRRADELVSRALAIDPNNYLAHFARAYVLMEQTRTQDAVVEGEASLALNPSFIDAYYSLCAANNFLGRPDRALQLADKAIRLSPRDPFLRLLYHMKGWAFFMKQRDDQAIEWLRRAVPFSRN